MTSGRTRTRALVIFGMLALAAGGVAFLAPVAAGTPAPCQAKNVRTGIDYQGATPLTTAINAANAGDTINVYGTCVGNFTVAQDLTLSGQGNNATLDGGGAGTVLHITNGTTTVSALEITNGVGNTPSPENGSQLVGGGIAVTGDTAGARLLNSLVTGNSSPVFGGGIDVDDGTLELVNSTVSGNTAASGSGGIDIDFATIMLTNSNVSGNTSAASAGGIWNFGGTLTLNSSRVTGNKAATSAGGVRNDAGGTLTLTGMTKISGNKAGTFGGGIRNVDPSTVVASNWTGSVQGNKPDQCSPTLTIGSTSCGS